MAPRAWLVIGVAGAAAAVVAWRLAARGGDSPPVAPAPMPVAPVASEPPHAAPTPTPAPPAPGAPAAVAPPRPELPALPPPAYTGPAKLPPELYAAEPRDDRWARPIEADLRRRGAALVDVRVDGIECKRATCKLTLAGSTNAVSLAIETLSGPRGLRVPITLASSQIGSDAATVTAYLAFPRERDTGSDAPDD